MIPDRVRLRFAPLGSTLMRRGLTLLELIVVLLVLVAMAGLAVPLLTQHGDDARETATRATLTELRDAVITYHGDQLGALPSPRTTAPVPSRSATAQLVFLFVNPTTFEDADNGTSDTASTFDPTYQRGWRGPYLASPTGRYAIDASNGFTDLYGEANDLCQLDAWGRPCVIQAIDDGDSWDVRIVSAGRNGSLETDPATSTAALTIADQGDDLHVAFRLRK